MNRDRKTTRLFDGVPDLRLDLGKKGLQRHRMRGFQQSEELRDTLLDESPVVRHRGYCLKRTLVVTSGIYPEPGHGRLTKRRLSIPRTTEILGGLADGDHAHLNELAARFLPRIHAWASRELGAKLRKRVDSEDIVQETFLAFVKDVDRICPRNGDELEALMRRLIGNRIADAHDRFMALKRSLDREIDLSTTGWNRVLRTSDSGQDPTSAATKADDQRIVRTSIFLLSPNHRESLVLYQEAGGVLGELAKRLDISVEAASKRVARAIVALKEVANRLQRADIPGTLAAAEAGSTDD